MRVLGFAVGPHQPPLPLLSPPTHCALSLEALPAARASHADPRQLRTAARSALRAHRVRRREWGLRGGAGPPFRGAPPPFRALPPPPSLPAEARVKVMARFSPECAVVLLEHLDTAVTRFLLSLPPLCRLFEPQVSRAPTPRRPDGRRAQREDEPDVTAEAAVLAAVGIVPCSPERGLLLSDSTLRALQELVRVCCGECRPPAACRRVLSARRPLQGGVVFCASGGRGRAGHHGVRPEEHRQVHVQQIPDQPAAEPVSAPLLCCSFVLLGVVGGAKLPAKSTSVAAD